MSQRLRLLTCDLRQVSSPLEPWLPSWIEWVSRITSKTSCYRNCEPEPSVFLEKRSHRICWIKTPRLERSRNYPHFTEGLLGQDGSSDTKQRRGLRAPWLWSLSWKHLTSKPSRALLVCWGQEATYYAAGHQGSLSKPRQDIAGMVLVVRHAGQSCVKGHHDQGELQERPEQAGPSPSEAGLQVQLEGGDKTNRHWVAALLHSSPRLTHMTFPHMEPSGRKSI